MHPLVQNLIQANYVDYILTEQRSLSFQMTIVGIPWKKQDRQCTYKRDIETRLRKLGCCGKAMSITYSECVIITLDIQHAMRTRRKILSSVACPAVPYFFHSIP